MEFSTAFIYGKWINSLLIKREDSTLLKLATNFVLNQLSQVHILTSKTIALRTSIHNLFIFCCLPNVRHPNDFLTKILMSLFSVLKTLFISKSTASYTCMYITVYSLYIFTGRNHRITVII